MIHPDIKSAMLEHPVLWEQRVRSVGLLIALNVRGRVVLVLEFSGGKGCEVFTDRETNEVAVAVEIFTRSGQS